MATFTGSFRVRHGTTALWAASDPVLADGELGLDTDLDRLKLGNNTNTWSTLAWATGPPLTFPPSASWTALNSGSVTADANGRLITLTSTAGDNWKGEIRTLSPASNYTATFYFEWAHPSSNYVSGGIVLRNSGSGNLISYGAVFNSSCNLRSVKWTSPTAFNADYVVQSSLTNGIPNWLRVRDDATTRFLEYSFNGVDWALHQSVGRTDFITPDQIGWGANSNNNGGTYTAITRLRSFSGVA